MCINKSKIYDCHTNLTFVVSITINLYINSISTRFLKFILHQ